MAFRLKLGQRLVGGRHGHAPDGSGGHIVRPKLYETVGAIGFAGRRRRVYDGLVALAGIAAGDRVCDVGCGTGYFTRRAAAAAGPTGKVTGIDPSEPVLAYARGKAPANADFVLAGGEAVPLGDGTCDVVVSSLAIHHIPPDLRPAAFGEMWRLLRVGGTLLVVDFRPPQGRVARHLIGALSGHAMAHNPIAELPALATGAGFTPDEDGQRWPMLYYLRAKKFSRGAVSATHSG
ncbi:MAG TPA: class I SAM-dependent methyltransferase [Candidatus Limnocylindrales bacterium]|nr:class I SAM-dependent methyltransferase [Candidatus Limnocylindrales bacterium]